MLSFHLYAWLVCRLHTDTDSAINLSMGVCVFICMYVCIYGVHVGSQYLYLIDQNLRIIT